MVRMVVRLIQARSIRSKNYIWGLKTEEIMLKPLKTQIVLLLSLLMHENI